MRGHGEVSTADIIVAAAGLLLTVVGIIAGLAIRVNKGTEALKAAERAQQSADEAKAALSDHKLWVAENYVSHGAMRDLENRITEQFRELGARIERLFHPTPREP